MYVLIDTNIWSNLITDPGQGDQLDRLEKLITDGTITLLVPEMLNKECTRRYPEAKKFRIDELEKSLRRNHEDSRTWSIEAEKKIMDEREKRIAKLLADGEQLPDTDEVLAFAAKRNLIRPLVPPFTKDGKNGLPDAVILYTATFWFKENNHTGLVFVSNNFKDYGDPVDRSQLDPALDCQLDVTYHPVLYTFLLSLGEFVKENTTQINAANNYIVEVCREKEDMLEYLYDVTKTIYSHVGFVPLDILARVAPFRIKDQQNSYTHFHGWVLYTNNQAVVDFFEMIDPGARPLRFNENAAYSNSPENLARLDYVTRCLNQNMVYHIGNPVQGGTIRFDNNTNRQPDQKTVSGQLSRMSWYGASTVVHPELTRENAMSILCDAGLMHDMGMEAEAAKLYLSLYRFGLKSQLPLLSFNVLFALRWRGRYMLESIQEGEEKEALEKELLEIEHTDPQNIFYAFQKRSGFEQEMASAFFQLYAITQLSSTVIQQVESFDTLYEGQLRGNTSSLHRSIAELFQRYIEYQFYLIENGIPFRGFTQFNQVVERYMVSLFKAYAMNHYQADRLIELNENMVLTLTYIRKPDKLTEYYYIYTNKPFAFNASSENRTTENIRNFLAGHRENVEWLNGTSPVYARQEAYYEQFWNFIVLMAIVDFDESFIRECGEKILEFLVSLELTNNSACKHLAIFIQVRGKLMGNEFLRKLMQICIEKREFHKHQIFNSFTVMNGMKHPPVLITTKPVFEKLLSNFDLKKQFHQDLLLFSHAVCSSLYKKKLAEHILQQLKETPQWHLYFAAAFRDVIVPTPLFEQYLSTFENIPDKNRKPPQIMLYEPSLEGVNQLMVLCFKFKLKLTAELLKKLKDYSDYYAWLVDMKGFKYDKFDPLWILQFHSIVYYKKIFSMPAVRKSVKKYLLENDQPRLAKLYAKHT